MKNITTLFCLLLSYILPAKIFAQNAYTFEVEKLQRPDSLLKEKSTLSVQSDIYNAYLQANNKDFRKILRPQYFVTSTLPPAMLNYGVHSFYTGMKRAYAEHRPFTLSPDMIWLLISQGFAQHVLNNAEQLRPYFVRHDGKVSLLVNASNDKDRFSPAFWEKSFNDFTAQIGDYTGTELINVLTNNFSTSTPATKVASQITIMESMKTYFEYYVMLIGCGIPEITLEGSTED